ncbi:hypothetical protein LCL95_11890 [Bacillus timonensis]|nr:hypothetical protein [Bacillus timonensis]
MLKFAYGIETQQIDKKFDEFIRPLETDITEEGFIVVKNQSHAATLTKLISEEELHPLVQLELVRASLSFDDYGIRTINHLNYLFLDMVSAFIIKNGNKEQIEMALYQFEEHIIATDEGQPSPIYFIDCHLEKLIKGIAKAYDIEVSFFDLDKFKEND